MLSPSLPPIARNQGVPATWRGTIASCRIGHCERPQGACPVNPPAWPFASRLLLLGAHMSMFGLAYGRHHLHCGGNPHTDSNFPGASSESVPLCPILFRFLAEPSGFPGRFGLRLGHQMYLFQGCFGRFWGSALRGSQARPTIGPIDDGCRPPFRLDDGRRLRRNNSSTGVRARQGDDGQNQSLCKVVQSVMNWLRNSNWVPAYAGTTMAGHKTWANGSSFYEARRRGPPRVPSWALPAAVNCWQSGRHPSVLKLGPIRP